MKHIALMFALLPVCSFATTLNFTFHGFQDTDEGITSDIVGNLSFANNLTTVNKQDLTSFFFADTLVSNVDQLPVVPPVTYSVNAGLSDVQEFAMTLGADGLPNSLDLIVESDATPNLPPFRTYQGPEQGDGSFFAISVGSAVGFVNFTVAPEPASAALLFIGGILACAACPRGVKMARRRI